MSTRKFIRLFVGVLLACALVLVSGWYTAQARAVNPTATSDAAHSELGPMTIERTDSNPDGDTKVMISQIENRSFRVTLELKDKDKAAAQALIDSGKIAWSLSRDKGIMPNSVYPKQWLGGPLESWKTVATKYSASKPFFKDITMTAKDNGSGGSIIELTFSNELLFGVNGIDVRERAIVRSAMLDYVGTFNLTCTIDGKSSSIPVDVRPYDYFHTQDEVDAKLDQLAAEANKNGMYAHVETIGTSAAGRPIRALFVAKSAQDLADYKNLTHRMENEPAAVKSEVEAGTLKYKSPIVYSNIHADEIIGVDACLKFADMICAGQPFEYRTITGLTEKGKTQLQADMAKHSVVWSKLIADKATGVGYIRGNGKGDDYSNNGRPSVDMTDEEFNSYYNISNTNFDPKAALDKVFFIIVPSENVDARVDNVRTNGNGFDLNRDNTYQTQPETRAMTHMIATWNPLSLHEIHGYYSHYQVEPCSPTHDPNNEYDLFIDTAMGQGEAFVGASIANNATINSCEIPLRDFLIDHSGKLSWDEPFDDMSTSYTPQYAMVHGTNAFTVELPYGTADAVRATAYGMVGNVDYIIKNQNKMFANQLERYVRGIKNIDADTIRPYYVNKNDVAGAEADIFRPRNPENNNFFPEYYVIPMDPTQQRDRVAAAETLNLLLRNDVKLSRLTQDTTIGSVNYLAGSIVVDMHQAKRNMANCVLYPNMVISNWGPYDLYSEPVTNFSVLRGFDMGTIHKVGAIPASSLEAVTADVSAGPTVINGSGPVAIIHNNGLDAVRCVNDLLKQGQKVGLILEGDHIGDYVVTTDVLNMVKDKYVLDVDCRACAPVAKLIDNNIKVYIPVAYGEFVKDRAGNPIGMSNYNNRLNTNGNWDPFALGKQMGFTLVNSVDQANMIAGSMPLDSKSLEKVKAGTPYVGYTADALSGVADLLPGLEYKPTSWCAFDATAKVEFPENDIITAYYARTADDLMYGYGGAYFTKLPEGAKTLIKIGQDQPIEGFMSAEHIASYKGSIQAFDYQKNGMNIALFANTLDNKCHQTDDYRYLSTAIFSKHLGEDFPAVEFTPAVTTPPTTEPVKFHDGLTLADVALVGGKANCSGTWAWKDPSQSLTVGEHEFEALFTPDGGCYAPLSVKVKVVVLPADATPTPAPNQPGGPSVKPGGGTAPKTSDPTSMLPLVGMFAGGVSLVGIALVSRMRKKS